MKSFRIGIADTTFARIDMAEFAIRKIKESLANVKLVRYTVPGVKDLPVAVKKLFGDGCDIVLAFGMVGPKPVDKLCAHEASLGLMQVQLAAGRHVIEVFVHEDEAEKPRELYEIAKDRSIKHALNAVRLLTRPQELTKEAGMGKRQGYPDVGPLRP